MGSKNANNHNKMNKKKKNNNNHDDGGGGKKVIEDPRFASVHTDPRFQKVPNHESKVEIDSRFSRMFKDKNFASSSAPLDPRGKVKKQNSKNFLRHYYRVEEEEEKEEEESESEEKLDDVAVKSRSSSSELEESEDDEESTTDEEDELIYEEDGTDVEVENIPTIEDGTRRLAVVNLDWRHVRALDLYVVLRSFLPKAGDILSVAVYPSEFGLQRMKEEEIHGPVGLFDNEKKKNDSSSGGDDGDDNDDDDNDDDDEKHADEDDDDDDDDVDEKDANENEDDEIDEDKLRAYEKSRLRYYYGVVECDSVATAEHLYKACDGVEFERSSNVFDLRFIPDSMEFKHPPRDVAKEAPTSYEGLDFHTKALQHSNIPISWDEDEPQRVKTLNRKFTADQLAEMELQEFLASDDSESDDDENDDDSEGEADKKEKKRDKYRALIQSGDGSDGENEEEGQDMEITFHTGLEGLSKRILEKKDKKTETVWEAHLRKQQEKKKARKRKSKHSSEDESSDYDEGTKEEADDFFVEEPPIKKQKQDARAKSDKEEKQLQDTDKEAEASKAELELLLADDNEVNNGIKGFNLKRKKAKGKREREVPDENKIPTVDYDDPRFSALFKSPLFALDPTDPQFKRSAAYARQKAQKQHKGDRQELAEGEHKKQPAKSQLLSDEPDANKTEHLTSDVPSSKNEKHEISALVRSIKMMSKQVQLPSNGKSKKDGKLQFSGTKEMVKPELSTSVQPIKKKAKTKKK